MTSEDADADLLTLSAELSVATRPAFELVCAALALNGAAKSEMTVIADKIKAVILFFIMTFLFSFG